MGLLGISVKGSLAIQTDRAAYRPGQAVNGKLTLVVHAPVDCAALVLTVSGVERAKWKTRGTSRRDSPNVHNTIDHKHTSVLFRSDLRLAEPPVTM
ncbi:hypothetical protein P43SY_007040 [Pythium insidiosum]|uniref:Arrestin-like N-terminal domain-containing protein n=1 Tax=Pythium insidiosum TaxID=114742 RepID=A0AAD5LAF6_PYTIN|nr:hypothetical protein P43SY_007040 [Pythium insidiosum]